MQLDGGVILPDDNTGAIDSLVSRVSALEKEVASLRNKQSATCCDMCGAVKVSEYVCGNVSCSKFDKV